jgi:hypothetical protein
MMKVDLFISKSLEYERGENIYGRVRLQHAGSISA